MGHTKSGESGHGVMVLIELWHHPNPVSLWHTCPLSTTATFSPIYLPSSPPPRPRTLPCLPMYPHVRLPDPFLLIHGPCVHPCAILPSLPQPAEMVAMLECITVLDVPVDSKWADKMYAASRCACMPPGL
jgi:hypothetical protein